MSDRALADFDPTTGHLHSCMAEGDPDAGCAQNCTGRLYAIAQDAERLIADMTSEPPRFNRPTFMSEELLGPEARALRGEPAREPGYVESQDGRRWARVVFGRDGVAAAETPDGELVTWNPMELFEAVFRSAEHHG